MDRLNELCVLYRESSSFELVYEMDFLVKYRNLDGHVVSNVTQIILDKVKSDPNIARVLDCLFSNPYIRGSLFVGDCIR